MTGVYLLKLKGVVVYVGATQKWPDRLKQHRNKRFDDHVFIECSKPELSNLEKEMIAKYNPKYNKCEGGSVGRSVLPIKDKKVGVSIYIQKKVVDNLGGRSKVATMILEKCDFLTA